MVWRILYNNVRKKIFFNFFLYFPPPLTYFFQNFYFFYKQNKAYFITNSTVYDKVMLRHSHFPKIIKNHSITHGTRTRPCTMELFPFDFDEPLIRCSTNQNKGHLFFYTCPISPLGGKTPLWRKSGFFVRSVETIRDKEKCSN
jgi:hypothetical protein